MAEQQGEDIELHIEEDELIEGGVVTGIKGSEKFNSTVKGGIHFPGFARSAGFQSIGNQALPRALALSYKVYGY